DRTRSANASDASRDEDGGRVIKRLAWLTGEGVETEGSWLLRAAAAAEAAEEEYAEEIEEASRWAAEARMACAARESCGGEGGLTGCGWWWCSKEDCGFRRYAIPVAAAERWVSDGVKGARFIVAM
uniref:Uncharacterized protein n=1 Tax=Triticum urartu TaxID=4572 RepID=A0A8R7JY99_TRIUA